MTLVRYLIRLSYIGTKYRGSQKHDCCPNETIQGVLEKALETLKITNKPNAVSASRTDKGVHALMNAFHVDLEHKREKEVYQPHLITKKLNAYLKDNNHEIIIKKTCVVPHNFHARMCAKWRSYVYRLAIPKPELKIKLWDKCCYNEYLPVSEINRCHIVPTDLDIQTVQNVAKIYCGTHDFTTFTKYLSREPWRNPVRIIDECRFYPVQSEASVMDPQYANISMWEFSIKSKAFLYHQIRKLLGAALSAGLGYLSLNDVELMLSDPSPRAWVNCKLPPPFGLYLTNIHYDKQDFILGYIPKYENSVKKCEQEQRNCLSI